MHIFTFIIFDVYKNYFLRSFKVILGQNMPDRSYRLTVRTFSKVISSKWAKRSNWTSFCRPHYGCLISKYVKKWWKLPKNNELLLYAVLKNAVIDLILTYFVLVLSKITKFFLRLVVKNSWEARMWTIMW